MCLFHVLKIESDQFLLIKNRSFIICKNLSDLVYGFLDKRRDSWKLVPRHVNMTLFGRVAPSYGKTVKNAKA